MMCAVGTNGHLSVLHRFKETPAPGVSRIGQLTGFYSRSRQSPQDMDIIRKGPVGCDENRRFLIIPTRISCVVRHPVEIGDIKGTILQTAGRRRLS
jgi:hypothetical protein